MTYTPKEGTGTAFVNKPKESPKHPDIDGNFALRGELYNVAMWVKKDDHGNIRKDKRGRTMFSMKVSPAQKRPDNPTRPERGDAYEDFPFE